MEATDFKNAIKNEIHLVNFETAEVQRMFSKSMRSKFQNHLVFITFHLEFLLFLFSIKFQKAGHSQKELGKYFQ